MDILKKIRQDLGLNQKEMGELLGLSQPQQIISLYEKRKRPPTDDFYKRFIDVIGIDLEKSIKENTIIIVDRQKYQSLKKDDGLIPGVPVYDVLVSAGIVHLVRDEPVAQPVFYLQMPLFKDCTFGARVGGDSMYPEIRNGDYVICKEVLSKESIIYGDIYLIITHDGVETVKYLHPHEKEKNWVNLVPHNKSIPPTPMSRDNIAKIFKVKGVLKGY